MAQYTIQRGTYSRYEKDGSLKTYRKGDTVELSDAEAKGLGDKAAKGSAAPPTPEGMISTRIEQSQPGDTTDNDDDGDSGDEANADDEVDWSATLEGMTAPDAVELAKTLDTKEDLEALRKAEASGKGRKSVDEAISERLKEIR